MDFSEWANPSMPQEYVSSSKASVKSMADKLQGPSNQIETENSEVSIENIENCSSALPPQSISLIQSCYLKFIKVVCDLVT